MYLANNHNEKVHVGRSVSLRNPTTQTLDCENNESHIITHIKPRHLWLKELFGSLKKAYMWFTRLQFMDFSRRRRR